MMDTRTDTATGPPAREPASPRDLADLARAGSAVIRQPLMQVTFEVHHVLDRPGYLADYVARKPAPPGGDGNSFGETLTTGSNGLGLVVVTRTSLGIGSGRQYKSGGRTQCQVIDGSESRIFRGTARPNPSFIYETAWRYEGLICIDPDATRARKWHCRVLRDVVHEVARLAKDSEAPIISLQAPAQVPPSDSIMRYMTPDRGEDMLPESSSLAVRFAIALQHPDAALVLTISERLATYCFTHGFGLWIADTRPGTRSGNWFSICPYNLQLSATLLASPAERGYVKRCLPITLVGPARIGSTLALASFLSQYREIGIRACSVASLDDLLFIHLELSFSGIPLGLLHDADREFDAPSASVASAMLPSDALIRVLRTLGIDRLGDHERAGLLVNNAGDYQCLVGPSRQVATGTTRSRMAVWFSWQAQGADIDLAIPLNGLLEALCDINLLDKTVDGIEWKSEAPNIEYLICRNMGNSVLRGKGKLSVVKESALHRYPYDGLEPRPTDLCVSIEDAWRARTAMDDHRAVRELTVARRECWLGHWSLPL